MSDNIKLIIAGIVYGIILYLFDNVFPVSWGEVAALSFPAGLVLYLCYTGIRDAIENWRRK